ncbi:MAG: L-glutamate gamma-semialdehyde dehydrogenase [Gemmataceae bacterium]|nr:L-glutamate gamma-semialdehyde dehydrogenase [Gemmataceae bacterium]
MGIDSTALEKRTRAYGEELFARIERSGPILLSPSWWDDRLMEWSMANEAVKLQLFRFIDALPLLREPKSISRHLREYFHAGGDKVPGPIRLATDWMPRRGLGAKLLAWSVRRNSSRLARRFIAGTDVPEAIDAVAKLRAKKLAFTVDLLGEATVTEPEAERYQQQYLDLIDGLTDAVNGWPEIPEIDRDAEGVLPRVNVSIKLSSLFSQFDPIDPINTSSIVRDRLRPILRAARRRSAFVNVDMEQHSYKDMTLRIFKELLDEPEFRDWPDVGIAIQAYLNSCEKDLADLAEWAKRRGTPVWIRLIKGAYWDYENVISAQEGWPLPVFRRKPETDANYEQMSLFLLQNHRLLRPAFGSHNVRSLAHAMAAADLMGLPPRSIEIQTLYGMADPIKQALVRLGQRVRVYAPFGQLLPGMAYLVRRLLENTANDSFLRASFTEHVPEEKLLMNPLVHLNGQESSAPPREPDVFRNEPVLDFAIEEHRDAIPAALAEVRKQFGRTYPLVIDGKAITSPKPIEVRNPSHLREIVGTVSAATPEQTKQAIEAAARAYPMWRDVDPNERADLLVRLAQRMRERRAELIAWEIVECAKPWREADADVAEAIDFCEYYAREMRRLATPQKVELPGEDNANFYDPLGVAVVIAPWNFPLAIVTGMTAAALVTGNTAIIKPAEQSSIVTAKLMEMLQEAGAPPGVVHYLPGIGEEIGPTLVEHPSVALIAFTGSRGVGTMLHREMAKMGPGNTQFKRLIAELGGKNAIIIDDDADLDEAVLGVVASAFGYSGQKCSACSRAIVLAPIYDVFLNRLIEATRALKIAPAEDPGCRVGPVIEAAARERMLKYIEFGKQQSRLAYAGDLGFLVNEGHYLAPHIFAEVPPTAAIAQEEIFGPVLAVMKANSLDEALSIANGVDYALVGGFFSRSPENIRRVRREFRVGNLYINRKITGAMVSRQPFGGFKMSGLGTKAGGPEYLQHFMAPRCVTENTMRHGFAPDAG